MSFCVAVAAAGHVPDGEIKIAIKKDYCAIRNDLISLVARPFPNSCRFSRFCVSQVEESREIESIIENVAFSPTCPTLLKYYVQNTKFKSNKVRYIRVKGNLAL